MHSNVKNSSQQNWCVVFLLEQANQQPTTIMQVMVRPHQPTSPCVPQMHGYATNTSSQGRISGTKAATCCNTPYDFSTTRILQMKQQYHRTPMSAQYHFLPWLCCFSLKQKRLKGHHQAVHQIMVLMVLKTLACLDGLSHTQIMGAQCAKHSLLTSVSMICNSFL